MKKSVIGRPGIEITNAQWNEIRTSVSEVINTVDGIAKKFSMFLKENDYPDNTVFIEVLGRNMSLVENETLVNSLSVISKNLGGYAANWVLERIFISIMVDIEGELKVGSGSCKTFDDEIQLIDVVNINGVRVKDVVFNGKVNVTTDEILSILQTRYSVEHDYVQWADKISPEVFDEAVELAIRAEKNIVELLKITVKREMTSTEQVVASIVEQSSDILEAQAKDYDDMNLYYKQTGLKIANVIGAIVKLRMDTIQNSAFNLADSTNVLALMYMRQCLPVEIPAKWIIENYDDRKYTDRDIYHQAQQLVGTFCTDISGIEIVA